MKFWSVFLERFGQPAIDASYKSGAADPEKEELEKVLEDWQNGTALAHSDNIIVQLLEAQKSGTSSYEGFTEYCNREIAKAILGQSVLTDSGQPGTQVSPKISNEIRRDLLLMDAATLQDVIEGQLVRWIVDFNFGLAVDAPHFVFETEPEEDLTEAASRDEKLVRMGLPVSKQYFYDRYKIPAPSDGDELVEVPSTFGLMNETPLAELRDKSKKVVHLKVRVPAPPRNAIGRYDVAAVARGRRKFAAQLDALFESLSPGLQNALAVNRPILATVEDYISAEMPTRLATILYNGNLESLRTAAESMAARLSLTVSENRFAELAEQYARVHAYDLGAAKEMTATIRDILSNRIDELTRGFGSFEDVLNDKTVLEAFRDDLLAEFADLTKSRAETIAVTETQRRPTGPLPRWPRSPGWTWRRGLWATLPMNRSVWI